VYTPVYVISCLCRFPIAWIGVSVFLFYWPADLTPAGGLALRIAEIAAATVAKAAAAAATKNKQDDYNAPAVISTKIKHKSDSILPLRAGLINI